MSDIKEHSAAELYREIQLRECAADKHPPSSVVYTGDGEPLVAYCRCNEVRWIKEQAP